MSPGYYRKLLLREWEKLAGNFLKQNNSKQNKGTSFMRGAFFLYNFFRLRCRNGKEALCSLNLGEKSCRGMFPASPKIWLRFSERLGLFDFMR